MDVLNGEVTWKEPKCINLADRNNLICYTVPNWETAFSNSSELFKPCKIYLKKIRARMIVSPYPKVTNVNKIS